jgi:hypothetical protein
MRNIVLAGPQRDRAVAAPDISKEPRFDLRSGSAGTRVASRLFLPRGTASLLHADILRRLARRRDHEWCGRDDRPWG